MKNSLVKILKRLLTGTKLRASNTAGSKGLFISSQRPELHKKK
ncbi:hypothetical protein [Sunxiuqinia elliptica]|uniref:Uncharacterized protein n=1 Tax=Sunxiuqinia elliptica TaxID=655355 RepID=A0A1I2IS91_9BACT|nr:hypothetical protein [Sunxiuqinia elliptica]TDN97214.1 hypothetical protein DET52_110131 [Sunxiuqinia elliptica]TDO60602.1 hypothetical protein DET65_2413 [Sunxiuqinia elliptica]SFF43381.1 hypothetical protein SAMN05216283_106131 [Sunxiuqinia elliptica]